MKDDLLKTLEATSREAAERQVVVPSGAKIAPIARAHGGFYETGAWRFPSPAAKVAFEQALAQANC